jgi:hypothetical protein
LSGLVCDKKKFLTVVIIKITRPKQKKKEKLGQFSGSKPSGLSPRLWALFKFREALDVLIMTSPLRVLKEALPLRVFKEARPDFGPFGTESVEMVCSI